MNRPTKKAKTNAMAMSGRVTAFTFSRKLDLKMSLKLIMIVFLLISHRFCRQHIWKTHLPAVREAEQGPG